MLEDETSLKTRGWPDGEIAADLAKIGDDLPPNFPPPFRAKHDNRCDLEVNGRKYTRRQLEHMGDAVVDVAAREMTHEKAGLNQKLYFCYVGRLISNDNLKVGGLYRHGKELEVEIGRAYAEQGLAAAVAVAKLKLEQTSEWKHFLRAADDPAVKVMWGVPK